MKNLAKKYTAAMQRAAHFAAAATPGKINFNEVDRILNENRKHREALVDRRPKKNDI